MVSIGAGAFRSLQSMAAPTRSTSKPSQSMACDWLNWMYFAKIARSFPSIRTPKCRSSEKFGLCGKRSLKSSSAALCRPYRSSSVKYGLRGSLSLKSSSAALRNVPCAYGGLLSGTVHVLIPLLGFDLTLVIIRSAKI